MAATGTHTPLSLMLPLKWAELPLNTPLAPPLGKPINPAQGFQNINWETEYQNTKTSLILTLVLWH